MEITRLSLMSPTKTIVVYLLIFVLANAENWSTCTKTCGEGVRTKKRCVWGNICSTVYRKCNTQPCVSGWGQWHACSKSCGGGIQFKVDRCGLNNITACPKTYNDCNTQACETLKTCPTGYRHRYQDRSSCCKYSLEQCGIDPAISRQIVGGTHAKQGEWPWAAAFVRVKDKVAYCGGSLIHKRWVLTASHCFQKYVDSVTNTVVAEPPEKAYILLGSVNIKNPLIGHHIAEIGKTYCHDGYKGFPPTHDIALVKLKNDVTFTPNIKPICLPKGEIVQPATTCWVIGWGQTYWLQSSGSSDRLKQVALKVYPIDACIDGFRIAHDSIWEVMDRKHHLCVGRLSGGNSSCGGDSGGPVVCQRCSSCGWFLAGTVSSGAIQCGKAGLPSINMDVYRYEYWIRKYVKFSDTGYYVC